MPFICPQVSGNEDVTTIGAPGAVTWPVASAVHPNWLVTTTVKLPAGKFRRGFCPLPGCAAQSKLNGPPPIGVKVIEPVAAPQAVCVVETSMLAMSGACVTVVERANVQPFGAVMMTENGPATFTKMKLEFAPVDQANVAPGVVELAVNINDGFVQVSCGEAGKRVPFGCARFCETTDEAVAVHPPGAETVTT